jgi:glycosyltransferase A (GT-A) superfamily protein (DUF2064 family)
VIQAAPHSRWAKMRNKGRLAGTDPAVVVMARAPRRGEVRRALEPLLGSDRCLTLQATLIRQTAAWGRDIAPNAVHVAHDPPDAADLVRPLVPAETTLFPQNGDGIAGRLADAAARVFARHEGPVLLVWPDLPRLRPEHAHAALSDFGSGCDVVLGPALEGGFYLIGLNRPLPGLFALPEQVWRSPDAMTLVVAAVRDAGLDLGVLRAERALHRPADVRAALADPLLPEDIGRVLGKRSTAGQTQAHELT